MNMGKNSGPELSDLERRTLITGGAGFIGTNLAHRLLSQRKPVLIFDNLSRPGVENNLCWLRAKHGDLLKIELGDMRDAQALAAVVRQASQVFDFAAQVAVTTSLTDPVLDFEINARGTLNLLEAVRALDTPPPLLFTSTNKVYGDLSDVQLAATRRRYEPVHTAERENGFHERRALNFHSPYGCSKGAAEQYVLDYARTFHLPALVFRMSCIYGPHQLGNEDQGWVAHFLIRALQGEPITVYGDGKQVRDILFIDDLINALLLAQQQMAALSGHAFNIGGGPANSVSLLELIELFTSLLGERPRLNFAPWRQADQRYYVADIRRFSAATGWKPTINIAEGVRRLYQWLIEYRGDSAHARGVFHPSAELMADSAGTA